MGNTNCKEGTEYWPKGPCTKPCGGGTQLMERKGDKQATGTGIPCPDIYKTVSCNTHLCPVDCIGYWGEWKCEATCDGINSSKIGYRKRTYTIITESANSGKICKVNNNRVEVISKCTKTDCPVNCVGNWGNWTACNATCNGINSSKIGSRTRTYTITRPAANGGTSCPKANNYIETDNTCTKTDCPVNCVGSWGNWTACNTTCDGTNSSKIGSRTRKYTITRPAANGGTSCPKSNNAIETDNTCTKIDCPVNCAGTWGNWTACNTTCDGINSSKIGSRTRKYTITRPATNGGTSCPKSNNYIETDNTCTKTDCPVNCKVGEWSSCNGNKRTRNVTEAINGGTLCTSEQKITDQSCNDCIGNWENWTTCSAKCDGINSSKIGSRTRTYKITTPATNSGNSCPNANNYIETDNICTKTDCPVNCILSDWSDWSVCDCKTKTNTRVRKILNNINNNLNCNYNLIEIKNCTDSDNNQCLKSECDSKKQIFNVQTKKCEDNNVLNIIKNLINILILYILNLFKKK